MYTLLLRLSAPLQSWGVNSMFDIRDTEYLPTKSAVIGMIAAALGRKRDEPLDDLTALSFGVRVDRQGERITDFQTTDMGTTDTEKKLNANLSYRTYLSDALFLVGLECEDIERLKTIKDSLEHPRFSTFLGRRSCPPTMPLVLGVREKNLYDALLEEEWLLPEWRRISEFRYRDKRALRIVMESDQGSAVQKDVPVSYSPFKREYTYRKIMEMPPKEVFLGTISSNTEHDAMEELR